MGRAGVTSNGFAGTRPCICQLLYGLEMTTTCEMSSNTPFGFLNIIAWDTVFGHSLSLSPPYVNEVWSFSEGPCAEGLEQGD